MNFYILLIILIIIIIGITFFIKLNVTLQSTPTEIHSIINNSYYFQKMTPLDLKARHASSKEDYIYKYKKAISTFTSKEIQNLTSLTKKADELLDGYIINTIPWKFAKLDGSVENGFPHTLGDTIFLSSIPSIQTLIHEKIHVYQRMYPIETTKLIHDIWEFQIKEKQEHIHNVRNNPDLNSFLYGKSDYYIAQLYTTENPNSLQDSSPYLIKTDKQYQTSPEELGLPMSLHQIEHPYELMASLIPQIILETFSKDQPQFIFKTVQWMNQYF